MKNAFIFSLIIALTTLSGCMEAGTHGAIKFYQYNVPKQVLEKALQQVTSNSKTIHQDTLRGYYNNDTTYTTISIVYGDIANYYIFRYGGDKEYWDTSKNSDISISYAHNKEGKGGSVGNGGVKWYNYKLKQELVEPFERELVSKIDSKLAMKHLEGK